MTKDRRWFERKVRELGELLRRLPRSRRRALDDTIETETAAPSSRYPESRSRGLYEPTRPPESGEGTYTPPAPYGVQPERREGTGGQLNDDEGESGDRECSGGTHMPKIGDQKPCIIDRCDGTMEWKRVRPPDAYPAGPGGQIPERLPDYEAWVCGTCGFEQKGSN